MPYTTLINLKNFFWNTLPLFLCLLLSGCHLFEKPDQGPQLPQNLKPTPIRLATARLIFQNKTPKTPGKAKISPATLVAFWAKDRFKGTHKGRENNSRTITFILKRAHLSEKPSGQEGGLLFKTPLSTYKLDVKLAVHVKDKTKNLEAAFDAAITTHAATRLKDTEKQALWMRMVEKALGALEAQITSHGALSPYIVRRPKPSHTKNPSSLSRRGRLAGGRQNW